MRHKHDSSAETVDGFGERVDALHIYASEGKKEENQLEKSIII